MTRKKCVRRTAFLAVFGATLSLNFGGCAGGAGFLGLQDYQRDLIFGIGGGLAGALLDNLLPQPPREPAGDPIRGVDGAQGPIGPSLFSVYVETFFNGAANDALGIIPVPASDPKLAPGGGSLAFAIAIPTVHETNPVMMRIILFRTGPCSGDCFAFSIDGRRAALGGNAIECLGGDGADCAGGTRTVLLADACAGVPAESPDVQQFVILDLPLGPTGLDVATVKGGDLLAFELEPVLSDGGTYSVLGVEFTDAAGEALRNATVFKSLADAQAACSAGQ